MVIAAKRSGLQIAVGVEFGSSLFGSGLRELALCRSSVHVEMSSTSEPLFDRRSGVEDT